MLQSVSLLCLTIGCLLLPHTPTDFNESLTKAPNSRRIAFGTEMGKYIKHKLDLPEGYQLRTIVIDAGHGGKDSGARGRTVYEKTIALKIALQLGEILHKAYPQLNILYTREDDRFIPLYKRAALANKQQADLFMSIHCNYIENASFVQGTETYVMGLHTADYNLSVAKRENASILLEENYEENYGGYDPNSPEGHIILSMFQNTFLEQSIQFADKVEAQFGNSDRKSRGVKQAGFAVLKGTTMPSVLIETGFLSNWKEEQFLASAEGQAHIALSVARAFVDYKKEVEGTTEMPKLSMPLPRVTAQADLPVSSTGSDPPSRQHKKRGTKPPAPAKEQKQRPATTVPAPKPSNRPKIHAVETPVEETAAGPIQFKVLLQNTSSLESSNEIPWHQIPYLVEIKKEDNQYKFIASGFNNYDEAVRAKNTLRELGFPEAFVVAYQGGERIPVRKALEIDR